MKKKELKQEIANLKSREESYINRYNSLYENYKNALFFKFETLIAKSEYLGQTITVRELSKIMGRGFSYNCPTLKIFFDYCDEKKYKVTFIRNSGFEVELKETANES